MDMLVNQCLAQGGVEYITNINGLSFDDDDIDKPINQN